MLLVPLRLDLRNGLRASQGSIGTTLAIAVNNGVVRYVITRLYGLRGGYGTELFVGLVSRSDPET
jgi:hypothetical protein